MQGLILRIVAVLGELFCLVIVIFTFVTRKLFLTPFLLVAAASVRAGEPAAPLEQQLAGVEEIVFAVRQPGRDMPFNHWYANFGYYATDPSHKNYGALGQLCRLNVRTGDVTQLIDDRKGSVRDPQVHYDGETILFSYRKGRSDHYHLYEIKADGSGLEQLTDGPYDDIEPTYLPDGGIMFCSSRCKRWVNCWITHVAVLYRCDRDGGNIRPISANIEHDNTPWPLPDGRILYQRWEYVDRSQIHYHHLWTTNPDGTGQMVYYGNMHPGTVMIDAKPIPHTDKVVAVFSPEHGLREHSGIITVVTPKAGPDAQASAQQVGSTKRFYRDPYPLSEDCFLVAQGKRLLVLDGRGETREIYRLPRKRDRQGAQCHEPRPLRPRPRERVIPARVDLTKTTGRLILADVYDGRRMDGVERGEIKTLLVMETLPKPINYTGGMHPISHGGTFTLPRILGTVPVAEDGSAYIELPALRSLFFVALDEEGNSVKRMQSFLTVMPGETTSCVGCHEPRTQTPVNRSASTLEALMRPPSPITPIPGIPDVFDFPRDIQPILDKHCLKCHDYDKRCGKVILTGDHGPYYSHSYFTLTARRQFSDGRNQAVSNRAPRSIGSSASPLMKKLDGQHHGVALTDHERDMIRYWIESGAPYPGTYAALGSGMIGETRTMGETRSQARDLSDREWPSSVDAAAAVRNRCLSCHKRGIPQYLSAGGHVMFNLTRPEKSLALLAPLAREAGGYGLCEQEGPDGSVPVFADTNAPDYQKILAMCRDGKKKLEEITRFDMPGFRPTPEYVREMKRFGLLPDDLAPDAAVDVYETDRAYWRSLWWQPQAKTVQARPPRHK